MHGKSIDQTKMLYCPVTNHKKKIIKISTNDLELEEINKQILETNEMELIISLNPRRRINERRNQKQNKKNVFCPAAGI